MVSNGRPPQFVHDPSNGRGYMLFSRGEEPIGAEVEPKTVQTFTNAGVYINQAEATTNRSLMIEGGPGAGKSHLARDLLAAGILDNRNSALLQLHIAAGRPSSLEETIETVRSVVDVTDAKSPLLILDNVDYLGYRSSKDTQAGVQLRLGTLGRFVADCINDPSITTIGIGHTQLWRDNNWTRVSEEVRAESAGILDHFAERAPFDGGLDVESAKRHLIRVGMPAVQATLLVERISEVAPELPFRYVHHAPRYLAGLRIPSQTAMVNVIRRINEDSAKRELRIR